METESIKEPILFAQLISYAETSFRFQKLKAIRKGSPIVACLIMDVIAAGSFVVGFLFGSVTLAFYLGSVLGSLLAGFGAVTGLFIVFGIAILALKKALQKPIVNIIIKKSCN